MGSVNAVTLVGNVGRDAELRYLQSGTAVANFSVATTEKYTNKAGTKVEQTEWTRITLFGKAAESLQPYILKGILICVQGRLMTREWVDKQEVKHKVTEVRADRVTLLGSGKGQRAAAPAAEPVDITPFVATDDDIPF